MPDYRERMAEIASRAIGFGDLRVGELMVPRAKIVALPKRAATAEVRRILLEEGRSQMPVYEGSLDNIVGYVIARDVLSWVLHGHLVLLEDILRPVHVVLTISPALEVLEVLQRRRTQRSRSWWTSAAPWSGLSPSKIQSRSCWATSSASVLESWTDSLCSPTCAKRLARLRAWGFNLRRRQA